MRRGTSSVLLALTACLAVAQFVKTFAAAEWTKVADDQIGPRVSPALFWSPERKRFLLVGGVVSHEHQRPLPYDVMSFNAAESRCENELPPGGERWGGEIGPVAAPGFAGPYFEMA